jgi:hypothetical protein
MLCSQPPCSAPAGPAWCAGQVARCPLFHQTLTMRSIAILQPRAAAPGVLAAHPSPAGTAPE